MAAVSLRVLGPGDEAALSAFLAPRAQSSLFLIANLAKAGVADTGAVYSGAYAGRFEDGALTGVVAHYWNGNLVCQAGADVLALARFAADASRRPVMGLIGPWPELVALRTSPDPDFAARAARFETHDILYALALEELAVPAALAEGRVACRRTRAEDLDLLTQWRAAYRHELMREPESAALFESAREEMARMTREGDGFVLEAAGVPVAYTGFNARTADIVQVGGVWTPPELRGRGYARAVVAGQLRIARDEGATRSVLFTGEENHAAQRAYESIGYRRAGEYGLVLFAE